MVTLHPDIELDDGTALHLYPGETTVTLNRKGRGGWHPVCDLNPKEMREIARHLNEHADWMEADPATRDAAIGPTH